jgi:hypothetical protein
VRVPDDTPVLFGHQEAGEVDGAIGQYVMPHTPPVCRCLLENLRLKEIDVGNFPGGRMSFADLSCVSDGRPTNDDHLLGHLEIFLRDVRAERAVGERSGVTPYAA